jgi:ribosomal protein S27E
MDKFYKLDPESQQYIECGSVVVTCSTEDCWNQGVGIEVADDPNGYVICGPCGQTLKTPEEAS